MKLLTLPIILLLATTAYASQKAITDTGDEVILNDDGTWRFLDETRKVTETIPTNNNTFVKSKEASFLLKSTKNHSAYWINPDKWSFRKGDANSAAEYKFQLKGGDLYGLAISEGVEVPLVSLTNIALSNARDAGPDSQVIKKEYRTVNGKKVIYMEMSGTIEGIKFTYLGYYYSDASGSTQYITYTTTNLVDKYRADIDEFLNGLVTR